MPTVATAGQPMSAELTTIKEWVKEDAQVKAIIGKHLSSIIQNMFGEKLMAHQQWDTLSKHFGRLDVIFQFELHDQLFSERLKDTENASQYISVFKNGRHRFAEMEIAFTNSEAIWMFLHGLPETPQWVMFQSLTLGLYKPITSSSMPTTTATVPPITFKDIAAAFSEEANRQRGQQKLAHPESEYANVASAPSVEQKVNPIDDIWIHRQNPKGVSCDNSICNRLPRSMTHDWEHCMQSGGEMESKAP